MKTNIILVPLIFVVLILSALQIVVSHTLTTAGVEITKIQLVSDMLELENEELRHRIASYSSLLSVLTRAKDRGFVSARYYYVDSPAVAMKP